MFENKGTQNVLAYLSIDQNQYQSKSIDNNWSINNVTGFCDFSSITERKRKSNQ